MGGRVSEWTGDRPTTKEMRERAPYRCIGVPRSERRVGLSASFGGLSRLPLAKKTDGTGPLREPA